MDGVQFSITGLDPLLKKMSGLTPQIRARAGRSALGKAANIVSRAARQNAERVDDPETGRRIRDNIGRRFRGRYFRRTGDLMISVGVLTKRGRIPKGNPDEGAKGNTPHWHLVELGTERSRAQPFLRPALEENINPAIDRFATAMSQELDKIMSGK